MAATLSRSAFVRVEPLLGIFLLLVLLLSSAQFAQIKAKNSVRKCNEVLLKSLSRQAQNPKAENKFRQTQLITLIQPFRSQVLNVGATVSCRVIVQRCLIDWSSFGFPSVCRVDAKLRLAPAIREGVGVATPACKAAVVWNSQQALGGRLRAQLPLSLGFTFLSDSKSTSHFFDFVEKYQVYLFSTTSLPAGHVQSDHPMWVWSFSLEEEDLCCGYFLDSCYDFISFLVHFPTWTLPSSLMYLLFASVDQQLPTILFCIVFQLRPAISCFFPSGFVTLWIVVAAHGEPHNALRGSSMRRALLEFGNWPQKSWEGKKYNFVLYNCMIVRFCRSSQVPCEREGQHFSPCLYSIPVGLYRRAIYSGAVWMFSSLKSMRVREALLWDAYCHDSVTICSAVELLWKYWE